MSEVSIEWVVQRDLVELNVKAAFTRPAITVSGNVHIIFGKRIIIKRQIAKTFQC